MKKLFLLLLVASSLFATAQPITDTGTLRTYINSEIVTNGTKAITAAKLNRILNGYLNTWPNNTLNAASPLLWNPITRTMSLPGWQGSNWNTVYNWWLTNNTTLTDFLSKWPQKDLFIKSINADTLDGEEPFEIVVVPDIQYMVAYDWGLPLGDSTFQWIARNVNPDSANIKAVLQVGDLTQWANTAGRDEFGFVEDWFDLVDATGVPYITVPGNHDYFPISASRGLTEYNNHFGASRYVGKPWFGGWFDTDPDNQGFANSYIKFDVGRKKFFVLGLEFVPRPAAIQWASGVLDSLYLAEPDREVMIVTHAYIDGFGNIHSDTTYGSGNTYNISDYSTGRGLWDSLISQKPNIKYVFSGHFVPGAGVSGWTKEPLHKRITAVGVNGNLIEQIVVNWQDVQTRSDGLVMRMKFFPSSGKVDVSFWSTYWNRNDTIVQPYTIDDPHVKINTGIAMSGPLATWGDIRTEGKLKSTQLAYQGIPVVSEDHSLGTVETLTYGIAMKGLYTKAPDSAFIPVTIEQHEKSGLTVPYIDFIDPSGLSTMQIRSHKFYPGQYAPNVGMGDSALFNAGSGVVENVAIGANVLKLNTSGSFNIGVGVRTMDSVVSTSFNTAFGIEALRKTTGAFNTALGRRTLMSNTSGADNAAVGNGALVLNTTGSSNTAFGSSALQNNTTGSFNVALGGGAGLTASVATENVLIGTSAARFGASLSQNVIIGRSAGANLAGTGNVIIGYQVLSIPSATIDNRLAIDNSSTSEPLLDGDFSVDSLNINGKLTLRDEPLDSDSTKSVITSGWFMRNRGIKTYTPSSSADPNGTIGDVVADDDYIYRKTATGWKRIPWETF